MTIHTRGLPWIWLVTAAMLATASRAQDLIAPFMDENHEPVSILDPHYLGRRASLDKEKVQIARDLLEHARSDLVIAQRARDRARFRAEMESAPRDIQERHRLMRSVFIATHDRFKARSAEIEKEYLADLRLLLEPSQEPQWEEFLRDRRVIAYWYSGGWHGLPVLDSILHDMKLSSQERLAVRTPLESHVRDFDAGIVEYLGVRKQINILTHEWESAPRDDDGDREPDPRMNALQARARAAATRLFAMSERDSRVIAAELPPDRAAEFLGRIDAYRVAGNFGIAAQRQEEHIAELMRISTLTRQQRTRLRSLIDRADREIAKGFRPLLSAYEASVLEGNAQFEGTAEELYAEASKAAGPIMTRLRQEMEEVLTAAQRQAIEDGIEPPFQDHEQAFRGDAMDTWDRAR